MKMLHVTIQTAKFDEEIAFYQDIVGLKIVRDMRTIGRNLVFLADNEGDTCIEIIDTPQAEDAGNAYLSVGFQSEDVDAMRDRLVSMGYEATPMISPSPTVKFFFVKDPAGVRVQFM